jgi:hypothetical protein
VKYFTKDWWFSDSEDAEAVFAAYDSYLSTIGEHLPASLLEFKELHTLHDAKVISCNFASNDLTIEFSGWDITLNYPVRYILCFSGVSQFDQTLVPQGSQLEIGDLAYWEIELVSSSIQVTMLFVSTAEFKILFNGFSFSHESLCA